MMKHIVCCVLALFLFGRTVTVVVAAPINGAEATITGYGMLVPRTIPGGSGGGSNNTGSTVRDAQPTVYLTTIPDAEIPMGGVSSQNSRLPGTGAAARNDYIWMLLLLLMLILLLARSKRRKPDYNAL